MLKILLDVVSLNTEWYLKRLVLLFVSTHIVSMVLESYFTVIGMCVTRKLSAFVLVGLYTVYAVITRHSCSRYIVYQPYLLFSCEDDRMGFTHSCIVEQVTWDHARFTQFVLKSMVL